MQDGAVNSLSPKEGEPPPKMVVLRHGKNLRGTPPGGQGGGLPPSTDAGHVGVELTGEATARAAFQEGRADGGLE